MTAAGRVQLPLGARMEAVSAMTRHSQDGCTGAVGPSFSTSVIPSPPWWTATPRRHQLTHATNERHRSPSSSEPTSSPPATRPPAGTPPSPPPPPSCRAPVRPLVTSMCARVITMVHISPIPPPPPSPSPHASHHHHRMHTAHISPSSSSLPLAAARHHVAIAATGTPHRHRRHRSPRSHGDVRTSAVPRHLPEPVTRRGGAIFVQQQLTGWTSTANQPP